MTIKRFQTKSHLFHGLLHVLHGVGSHKGVQGLVLARQHLPVLPAHLALLHRPFAPDHDLGTALFLNVLKSIATGGGVGAKRIRGEMSHFNRVLEILPPKTESNLPWANEQTDKVDLRVFVLRNHDFVIDSGRWRPSEKAKIFSTKHHTHN